MRISTTGDPQSVLRHKRLVMGPVKSFTGSPTHILDTAGSGTVVFKPATPFAAAPRGGLVLPRPSIMPIFWGAEWASPSPPIAPAALLDSIHAIINGPYLDGLLQYGFTGKPTVLGPRYITNTEPAAEPTLASWHSDAANLLNHLIDADQIAEPDEDWSRLSVIFLPSMVIYPTDSKGQQSFGFHNSFQWVDYDLFDVDNDPVRYAVIGTAPYNWDGTHPISGVDMATYTFSHELVEAMTDPDPLGKNGWTLGKIEIADPCSHIARLNGVAVASYWSNADNACIIPNLTRTAYFEVSDTHVDAEDDGPEVSFHVDRDCGRDHHWSGSYTYHFAKRHLTVTLQAKLKNWVNPTGDWTVGGVEITPGVPKTFKVNLPVIYPRHPDPMTDTKLVTITATATNDQLVLVNDPWDGNYSVPVVYTVTEITYDTKTWSMDVEIEGQALVYPQAYIDALSRCYTEQLGTIASDMKGLREINAEFEELLKNHAGPPVNEDAFKEILRAAGENFRELRSLAMNVRRGKQILGRGVD